MKCKSNQQGYSMAELIVVLAIVAVVTTLGSTSFRGMAEDYQGRSAAFQVEDFLYEARSLARSLLCDVEVSFQNGAFVIDGTPFESRTYPMGNDIASITFSTASGTLVFNPDGGTNEANPTVVTVTTYRNQVYVLTVYPAIGTIRRGEG